MQSEKEVFHEQMQVLEKLIPNLDAAYGSLTRTFKWMTPLLKKSTFNDEDQGYLKDFLHSVHEDLAEFDQLLRRGEGERHLLRSEFTRIKNEYPNQKDEEFSFIEAELWSLEQSLLIREKCLNHLNELVQLLDSVIKLGEMTELDERLLTEIVTDLKNIC